MVAPFEIYKKNATKIFWKNIWKILSGIPNGLKFASKQKTAEFFMEQCQEILYSKKSIENVS